MARLYLVRHAVTAETGSRLSGRTAGIPLSEAGQSQAAALAERFASGKLTEVLTSPVQRCRETATAIGATTGVTPRVDWSFLEVDYGTWTGRTFAPLRRTKLWQQLFVSPSRVTFPAGESLRAAGSRAVGGIEAAVARSPRGRIAVVSHADIIKMVVSHYVGQPFDLYQRLAVSPASVSVLDLPERGFPSVVAVNTPDPGPFL
ncbi:MAG: phosphoglycerate mutase [Acidimicrobiia bacterium]|nr:histidine phosphatase family protein [Acidimicrobiia bacterium]MBT8215690.1 histidine phosphatase family protein [Acidimicrobiia bacterium]NNF10423.1 phosphoglycerate mutase [Acidimicrobiia bacterium]NNL70558.1 phosphoglycerate mutase [Acidimicrobiia bacterium]